MESKIVIAMNFNLEQAIQEWRKRLHKHAGLEPGDLEELEIHLRDAIDDQSEDYESIEEAFN